jgi:hypothetical protein
VNLDKITNYTLLDSMWMLCGRTDVSQMAEELGAYARVDGDTAVRLEKHDHKSVDQSLVRRWLTGERPMPKWVDLALLDLLERRKKWIDGYLADRRRAA